MQIVRESILNENPDIMRTGENKLYFDGAGAYAFGYKDDRMLVSKEGATHAEILNPETGKGDLGRFKLKYAGRLWTKEKIISFWDYPSPEDFPAVIDDLSSIFNVDMMKDPEWQVEVLINNKGGKITDTEKDWYNPSNNDDVDWAGNQRKYTTKLISVNQYSGSEQRRQKDLAAQHILSPLLKKKKEVPAGWGSNSERYKRKRQWQMADLAAESVSNKGSKINESPDNIKVEEERYHCSESTNIPFILVLKNKYSEVLDVNVGKMGAYHTDSEDTMRGSTEDGYFKDFQGRLFFTPKIITFWQHPNKSQLAQLIPMLEKKLNKKILNDGWRIELAEQLYDPIEEYLKNEIKAADPSEEDYKQHMQSPLLKKKKNVPYGYGSKNPKYMGKRQWQLASLTSESIQFNGFNLNEGEKEFWNDELDLEDKMDIFAIARNVHKHYGRDCLAARLQLKKTLRPIYDFSDNFIKWLLRKYDYNNG